MPQSLAPAAQYLRMSTDRQQYSLDNQADAISRYAADHGFVIVKTYSDPAKSGLRLKNRPGLKQLLKDVVDGQVEFRAVLVYDISRWGRFQDADEAAHYEYLCKSSRVPVHYCAEMFLNDNSLSEVIAKAAKRAMAGQYSRDLSVKVRAGLFRLAKLGYKLGGNPSYGLRRLLLDVEGKPKQLLVDGERKSIVRERVILVPGEPEQIAIVRRVFTEFADEHRSLSSIAKRLNEDGIPFLKGAKWGANSVTHLLKNTQYVGTQTWGKTTAFLSGPAKSLPPDQWAVCRNAFGAIVPQELFDRAQDALVNLTCRLTDQQMLDRLRIVLRENGKLTAGIIQQSRLCPGSATYCSRFGGLLKVYARLGYNRPEYTGALVTRQRVMLIRESLVSTLLEHFPDRLQEVRRNRRFRSKLRDRRTGLVIAVMIARCYPTKRGDHRWFVDYADIPRPERARVTLLALLDESNATIGELRVFPKVDFPSRSTRLREDNDWLQSGTKLEQIVDFFDTVRRIRNTS